jgi:hypothetical protein
MVIGEKNIMHIRLLAILNIPQVQRVLQVLLGPRVLA